MDWHFTEQKDIEILQNCAMNNDFYANNYSALNSILYQKKYNSQISINNNWIFERFEADKNLYYSFPHNIKGDKSESELKSAINELLNELYQNAISQNEKKIIFSNVTPSEKDLLLSFYPSAKVTESPDLNDYIYLTKKLSSLEGHKYSKKRNHISQFKKKYSDYSFELLNKTNINAVYEIEDKWFEENISADLQIERKLIHQALENFDYFANYCGMSGGILFVNKNPVAFCISSLLSSSVTDIHFEKCISSFAHDGAYAVINKEFARTVQTEYINREEDLGIEGLRKAKLSYHPDIILSKYRVEIIL